MIGMVKFLGVIEVTDNKQFDSVIIVTKLKTSY